VLRGQEWEAAAAALPAMDSEEHSAWTHAAQSADAALRAGRGRTAGTDVAVVTLLIDSLSWAATARALARGRAPIATVSEVPGELVEELELLPEPQRAASVEALLTAASQPPTTWSTEKLLLARASLQALVERVLRGPREAALRLRSLRRHRAAVLLAGPLFLVALGVVVALGTRKPLYGDNLALRHPVTTSSVDPEHPGVKGVVDGVLTGIGMHTRQERDAWVVIDLGSVQQISRVHVYNSDHCCQERASPLALEVSEDGTQYRKVASRHGKFREWEATFEPTRARWVKVRLLSNNYLHLSEIEVYR